MSKMDSNLRYLYTKENLYNIHYERMRDWVAKREERLMDLRNIFQKRQRYLIQEALRKAKCDGEFFFDDAEIDFDEWKKQIMDNEEGKQLWNSWQRFLKNLSLFETVPGNFHDFLEFMEFLNSSRNAFVIYKWDKKTAKCAAQVMDCIRIFHMHALREFTEAEKTYEQFTTEIKKFFSSLVDSTEKVFRTEVEAEPLNKLIAETYLDLLNSMRSETMEDTRSYCLKRAFEDLRESIKAQIAQTANSKQEEEADEEEEIETQPPPSKRAAIVIEDEAEEDSKESK